MVKGTKNIAIVDDDSEMRQIIDMYLVGESNYTTTHFSTGKELLEYLEQKTPDMILLDIEMPGMSGLEVFDKIKNINHLSGVPIIFLTVKEDRSTLLKCIGRGAEAYLIKPVVKQKLLAKVGEVFDRLDGEKCDKTILLVDDDAEFLKISKIRLSKYYKVLTVNSGKTALDYLEYHKVDLIILDYFMPLYDGRNVLNSLKEGEKTKDVPVIMVSNLAKNELLSACEEHLPDGVVSKPVDTNELVDLIAELTKV